MCSSITSTTRLDAGDELDVLKVRMYLECDFRKLLTETITEHDSMITKHFKHQELCRLAGGH